MKKSFFTLLLGLGVAFGANIQTLTQQCEANNAKACYDLGVAYYNGKGVDSSKAFSLFKKACDLGSANGCSVVGVFYSKGAEWNSGVAKDSSKAFAFYKKACDMGDALGCNNVGFSYYNGKGVAKDLSKAFSFAKKACDMGWAQACYDVGNYYYGNYGTGVKKDINAAKNYSKKACSMGYQKGCDNYKIMLRQGGGGGEIMSEDKEANMVFVVCPACGYLVEARYPSNGRSEGSKECKNCGKMLVGAFMQIVLFHT